MASVDEELIEIYRSAQTIAVVDVFRPSDEAPAIAREAVALGAKVLWLQVGIQSDEAATPHVPAASPSSWTPAWEQSTSGPGGTVPSELPTAGVVVGQ